MEIKGKYKLRGERSMMPEKNFYSGYEVSKKLNIALYLTRYYEKELGLEIKKNTQGHRMYTEKDISTFKEITRLRKQGINLKEISILLQTT